MADDIKRAPVVGRPAPCKRATALSALGGSLFVLLVLAPPSIVAAPAQDTAARSPRKTRERLIGLLNLPEVVPQPCGPDQPVSVDLFATSSATRPPIAMITLPVTGRNANGMNCSDAELVVRRAAGGEMQRLPVHESGYEIPAAIVYERSGPWYRIALPRGSAWIKRTNPKDFLPYPALLHGNGAHLVAGWGGKLWRTAGTGRGTFMPKAWRQFVRDSRQEEIDVDILGRRRIGRELWVHVRFARKNVCEEPPDDLPNVSGWVPAYRPSDGETNLWFYSRGC
jgi:hypothetical protein